MTIKFYGQPITTCTCRVQTVLDEKEVSYELIVVDTANKAHKGRSTSQSTHSASFPTSPRQDDEGFIVYESRAICHYIATKFADQGTPELVPTDPKDNARFQQATSIEQSYFNQYAEKAVAELYESHIKLLDANLDGHERILGKQRYLAGDNITLADLYHLPYGSLLAPVGATLLTVASRPNVARRWKDITSHPSWKKYAYPDGMSSKNSMSKARGGT